MLKTDRHLMKDFWNANRVYDAGYHTECLDGRTLFSGICFIRMEADRFQQVVKMELVK